MTHRWFWIGTTGGQGGGGATGGSGGTYGGGAGGRIINGGVGGKGGVRIIWAAPGSATRAFPSTNKF